MLKVHAIAGSLLIFMAGCGDHLVGGTSSGVYRSMQLSLNETENLDISTEGSFQFQTPLRTGSEYNVRILTPPDGLICEISNGQGIVGFVDITTISLECNSAPLVSMIYPWVVVAGEEVQLSGYGLARAEVEIDGEPITPVSQSENEVRFIAPEHGAGVYPLIARSVAGQFETQLPYGNEMKVSAGGGTAPMVLGELEACAASEGNAACWGQISGGRYTAYELRPYQVIGEYPYSPEPLVMNGISGNVTAISMTPYLRDHCAVIEPGTVSCWTVVPPPEDPFEYTPTPDPFPVTGFDGVDTIATRVSHPYPAGGACALLAIGAVQCWQPNAQQLLANDGVIDNLPPVTVAGIDGIAAKAIDIAGSCALIDNGAVRCWGANGHGELGDGTTTASTTPVTVSGIDGIAAKASAITSGLWHNCALLDSGEVRCWGEGYSPVPMVVAGGDGSAKIVSIASHVSSDCGLLETGDIQCWKGGARPSLGRYQLDGKPAALAIGDGYYCVVLDNDKVNCLGRNNRGQSGYSQFQPIHSPLTLSFSQPMRAIEATGTHLCAVLRNGAIECRGDNQRGQLGDGTTQGSTVPVTADGIDGTAAKATSIALGREATCAILETGAARCWGYNGFGGLGNGSQVDSAVPVDVTGIDGGNARAIAIDVGSGFSCALLDNGAVRCWGSNFNGTLGNNSMLQSSVPVAVSGIDGTASRATYISAGLSHACAVLDNGAAKCWGRNYNRELGDGTTVDRLTPVIAAGIDGTASKATQISVGSSDSCALLDTGALRCWGGAGAPAEFYDYGIDGIAAKAVAVASGADVCALLDTGAVRCAKAFNFADEQTYVAQSGIATTLRGLDGAGVRANAVSSAGGAACAVLETGAAQCWGYNGTGMITPRLFSMRSYGGNDVDADSRPDNADNCPTVANPDQLNRNGNRHGDVCDPRTE
jgi:alpha-tubulin suppressor-like RCC1 family protein